MNSTSTAQKAIYQNSINNNDAKAINVFEMLLEKHPHNEWYRSKLDDLKEKLEQQKDK